MGDPGIDWDPESSFVTQQENPSRTYKIAVASCGQSKVLFVYDTTSTRDLSELARTAASAIAPDSLGGCTAITSFVESRCFAPFGISAELTSYNGVQLNTKSTYAESQLVSEAQRAEPGVPLSNRFYVRPIVPFRVALFNEDKYELIDASRFDQVRDILQRLVEKYPYLQALDWSSHQFRLGVLTGLIPIDKPEHCGMDYHYINSITIQLTTSVIEMLANVPDNLVTRLPEEVANEPLLIEIFVPVN